VQTNDFEGEAMVPAAAMAPLHPDHKKVLRIRAGGLSVAATAIALVLDLGPLRDTPVPAFLIPAAVLLAGLLLTFAMTARRYRAWGYAEGEDELQIRHGLWTRVRTVVPFGRVQHIDVAQGPIQRRFALATLTLHTAGTHGAAVALPGILHSDAEAMRDRIRLKIRQDLV
jgi:membrane protein YdbS with pleckstrin-like domain